MPKSTLDRISDALHRVFRTSGRFIVRCAHCHRSELDMIVDYEYFRICPDGVATNDTPHCCEVKAL